MEYSLGLLPDKEDSRDLLMAPLMPRDVEIPDIIDCREFMGAVRSQGDEGCCGGFSAAGMKEYQEMAEYQDFIQLSPRFVYERSREVESIRGQGTTLRAVMKALNQYGICEEKFWPYKANKKGTPKNGYEENALQYRIVAYAKLESIDDIMRSLVLNGPACAGLYVTPEWNKVPRSGLMDPPTMGSFRYGGHAIVIVGVDRPKKLLLIRNSWGLSWGRAGYAWIPFDSVIAQLISAWSATDMVGN
jgi:papain like protease